MSISNLYPTIAPSLNLSFALTKALDPRITFTRTTTATYYGTETAKAEENLLLQSQDFTTTWSVVDNVSITANTATAPDSTVTADTLAETAVTGIHTCSQNSSSTGVLTLSVFAKLDSGTPFLTIGISTSGSSHSSATFDLSLGTSTQTQVNGGNYSSPSATITAVAQSFYRCTFTVTTTDTATLFRVGLNNTGTPTAVNRSFGATYLGVVTNSIFIWGAQLEQRSAVTAYTPTTTQPITNYIPVLETAAAGEARFDHNPTTFESLGLLVEEQRTNLLVRSEEFDNATWSKTASSVTANTIVAPDGTLTGDKLVEDTANAQHDAFQVVSGLSTGATHTYSFYAKAAERTNVQILFSQGANNALASANLSAGTISAVTVNGGVWTGASATITSVGNGWYRVTLTATIVGSSALSCRVILENSPGSTSYTGNGFDGIFIWGAQLEAGAFPTSYIATTSASVTRNADAASMTGTNFSSWYRADEGSAYVECARSPIPVTASTNLLDISNGTTTNRIRFWIWSGATSSQRFTVVDSVNQADLVIGTPTQSSFYKSIGTYKANDFAGSMNGGTVQTDTLGTIQTGIDRMTIGSSGTGGEALNGYIKRIAFYPARLTDAQLQALTS